MAQTSRAVRGSQFARVFREASGVELISPIGLSLAGLIPLAISVMLPPALYSGIVHEDDLMFGNVRMILFYVACILAHIAGCWVVLHRPRKIRVAAAGELKSSAWLMIAVPLGLAMLLDIYALTVLLRNNPGLIATVLSGRGENIKQTLDAEGAFSGAQPVLVATIWYAMMRLFTIKRSISPAVATLLRWMIAAAVCLATLVSLVKVARYEIIPMFIGFTIIGLRLRGAGKSAWFFLGWGLAAIAAILTIFAGFAVFRGGDPFASFIGYGPVSFNHLSALLSGKLHYPANGVYTVGFLSEIPLLHRFIDTGSMFQLPDPMEAFKQEFDLTNGAGLNGQLIWLTTFGYFYVDLGIFVFVWLFGLGLLTGYLWKLFDEQKVFGLCFYPLFAASIALWSTSNFLTRPPTISTFFAALIIWAWERGVSWRRVRGFKEIERDARRRPGGSS